MTRPAGEAESAAAKGRKSRLAGAAAPRRRDDLTATPVFLPIRSHLQAPRPGVAVIPRPGVVAVLRRASAPLIVVSAPAGYGKTLALAEWARAEERPTAWLQLDTADNDPVMLLAYLGLALAGFAPVDPELTAWLNAPVTPVRSRILPALEVTLDAAPPFVLVLDDAHLVRAKPCWDIVGFVIDHLPPGAQVALGTREQPPLRLARRRASGSVAELGPSDLALSRDEARALLRLHGRDDAQEYLDALMAATEGWAAGLYLALLASEGRPAAEGLPAVRGDERLIADFLTGEVLGRQPYRMQEFLLRTSVLERFTAPLCAAVTGRSDADAVLGRLARENLFVTPLDACDEWFRYHHLFAECLRAQFQRQRPEEVPRAHRAAADWHRDHGDPALAVAHWLASGDVEPAADLASHMSSVLMRQGQMETIRRVLDWFTEDQILTHRGLTLTAGWVYGMGNPHWVTRRSRERTVRAACVVAMGDEPGDAGATARSSQLQLRAFLAPDGIARMLADARQCVELFAHVPHSEWYMDSCKLLGIALYLSGQPAKALSPLRVEQDLTDPMGALYSSEVLAFQALIAGDQGRWDEAEELAERAWERAELAGTEVEHALAVLLACARVRAQHGDEGTVEAVVRAARFLDEMPNVWDRELLLGAVLLGEIQLGRGELEEAERWAARARATLRRYPDAGMLRPRAERLRLALQERRLGLAVTAAEQRVLDLLPTELSVKEIGARLFISLNTMRSHLRSLYAKLGVHSRAEAVSRARSLGLLPPAR